MKSKMIYLSYCIDKDTPTYGNRNVFCIERKSDMKLGAVANDSYISTTVHIGTHLDMPLHFYEDGSTIEDFAPNYWFFFKPLFIEITPRNKVVYEEVAEQLDDVIDENYDILIVKTSSCYHRNTNEYWQENIGFHPDLYNYIVRKFPAVRVLGFDSISVSSFTSRDIGREAHKRFLQPMKPILLLEDMDLRNVSINSILRKIIIAPLRISSCDGLPCTVFGEIE